MASTGAHSSRAWRTGHAGGGVADGAAPRGGRAGGARTTGTAPPAEGSGLAGSRREAHARGKMPDDPALGCRGECGAGLRRHRGAFSARSGRGSHGLSPRPTPLTRAGRRRRRSAVRRLVFVTVPNENKFGGRAQGRWRDTTIWSRKNHTAAPPHTPYTSRPPKQQLSRESGPAGNATTHSTKNKHLLFKPQCIANTDIKLPFFFCCLGS